MSDKISLTIDVTPEERQRIETLAHQHGYQTLSEYLLALVAADDPDEDTLETIRESFKQGWREAMSGKTIPASQLLDALQEDD